MQEIKKSRIVIASVLKPVDDTRMFEKFAQSLSAHYAIHLVGYPTTRTPATGDTGITLHPAPAFSRLSLARLLAPWRILRKVLSLKPALLIINTHELLLAALLSKILLRCRVVYDIRENYYRNILHTNTFGPGVRRLLALYVRLKEKLAAPFIDHFLVAEKSYPQEMTFLPPNRTAIVENKLKRPTAMPLQKKPGGATLNLLFSGTLAESTGVFQAVDLAEALHAHDTNVKLTLIGYCARKPELEKLRARIRDKPFITLVGGDRLVPHPAILDAVAHAGFGIIAYPPNPSTDGAIPTKLYEYLGHSLPILITDHPQWLALCELSQAALLFDPHHLNAVDLLHAMKTRPFYTTQPENIYWEDEERHLTNVVDSLIKS
jgi:hypothetical protein